MLEKEKIVPEEVNSSRLLGFRLFNVGGRMKADESDRQAGKRKNILTVIGVIFLMAVLLHFFVGNPVLLKNKLNFKQAVQNINTDKITLQEITPFEWDKVYTFQPYLPKQKMEEIMGLKSTVISETVNEGMTQLVFVNNGKIVCYINGYSEDLGYYISFLEERNEYSVINYENNAEFLVSNEQDKVSLVLE